MRLSISWQTSVRLRIFEGEVLASARPPVSCNNPRAQDAAWGWRFPARCSEGAFYQRPAEPTLM